MDFDELMNSLDFQTAHWVEAVLTNDETASDDELVEYFMQEGNFTKEEAEVLVSKRGEYIKVILIGNLTRDPELRHTAENKKAVCTFGLATNRMVIAEGGEKQDEPEFHRIIAWDKLAEVCNQYLKKGRKVYVEGRLQYRTYTGQDGIEKFSAEIVLEDMAMLDSNMPKEVKDALDFHNNTQQV
jgi:single-strand DNA-binding protein